MSGLTLRKWDSTQHLKTEEDMAQYLEACLQEAGDDAAFIAKALGNIARAKGLVEPAGISRRRASRPSARLRRRDMLAEFPQPPRVPRLRSPLSFAQANKKAHPCGQAFSFAWWWGVTTAQTASE